MIFALADGAAVAPATPGQTARCMSCDAPVVAVAVRRWKVSRFWRHLDGRAGCFVWVDSRGRLATRAGGTFRGRVAPLAPRVPADASAAAWALERLILAPGAALDPELARIDFLAWHADRSRRAPEPRSKMRAAVKLAGGTPKGLRDELRYLDVMLDGPGWDSGYRSPRASADPAGRVDPLPALVALAEAGLVTDTRALDMAAMRLSGQRAAGVCGECGKLTRREGRRHVGCE